MTTPFRFSLQISNPLPEMTWAETARRVEDAGFSSLAVPDHFADQVAPIVAMTAAAAATQDLIVSCLVFDNDYRHPIVLGKEMSSLALMFPGRVEFGLGAGWMKWDYETAGMQFDAPKVRVDRFEEALAVYRGLFHESEVTFSGEHYQVESMPSYPAPAKPPRLMIGGGGPRMLRLAAENADIVAVSARLPNGEVDAAAARDLAPAAVDRKLDWIRKAAGNRMDSIELNALVFMAQITNDAHEVATGVAAMFASETPVEKGVGKSLRAAAEKGANGFPEEFTAEDVLQSPAMLLGSIEEMAERLQERRERWGISYIALQGPNVDELEPLVQALAGT